MSNILRLLELIKSENHNDRYDACEQLRVWREPLPQEAINALNLASNDSNADVAYSARRPLSFHALVDNEKEQKQELDTSQQATLKATISQLEEKIKLENTIKGGASNFYWIAGLSIINSTIVLTGGRWSFFIGLGITQLIDGIFMAITQSVGESFAFVTQIIGFIINIIVAGVFLLFGIFARKQKKWAFIAGMVLYALDSLIFLLVPDFLSIGFPIFILFLISGGMSAMKKYSDLLTKISA